MVHRFARVAVDVNWRNLALGHEVFAAQGATFVRNRALPGIFDANFVFGMTASTDDEIEQLLSLVSSEYAHTAQITFRTDPFTPPTVEARLELEGFDRSDALILLLEGPPRRQAMRVDLRLVEDEVAWRAYAELKLMDWREYSRRSNEDQEDVAIPFGLASSSRLKCPPVQYVLAYADGRPVGHCNAWEGSDGIGQVEDLFVHPAYRRRGFATALLHECVTRARARGAGPVVIVVDPTNTAKDMYAALGWQPIALCRQYGRRLPTDSAI
jgi:ribosomal protein S18 acetylase RimI-like enzyme